jgi:type IV secretory pathway component VirB8
LASLAGTALAQAINYFFAIAGMVFGLAVVATLVIVVVLKHPQSVIHNTL